ncbi:Tautomerase/MIF superfamily [Melanogaster broomeanus]|nr:Tautomerase/MIF superfamily [Melanogaster broomeanus]
MPMLLLATNVKFASEDATKAFVTDFSKVLASQSHTYASEAWFSVYFSYNPYMTFAGTFDPAVLLTIASMFNTNPTNSKLWSKAFADYFQEKLGVPSDRGYMAFFDPGPEFIGTRGTSVAALIAASGGSDMYQTN